MPDGRASARPAQRLTHPLGPAIAIAGLVSAGLVVDLVFGLRTGVWAWWILIGLVSGYAISGSV
jgi:hypothetical protein